MKYLVRAVKYFFYYVLLLSLFLLILVMLHLVESDVESMFRNGYTSLIQIGVLFAVVAAFYPIFGFVKKDVSINGEFSEIRDGIVEFMDSRNYILERADGENLYFRQKSTLNRITRMFEDRVSLTRRLGGFTAEGLRKDVIRLAYGLESKFSSGENN